MVDKMKVTVLQRGGMMGGKVVLEKAARFFARNLLSPRLVNQLSLRIEMRSSNLKTGAVGQAFSSCRMVPGDRKEYTVRIQRDMCLDNQLLTLAHEIAHVEQYMRGRLKYKQKSKLSSEVMVMVWLGQPVYGVDNIPWAQRPWEIEAVEREKKLFAAWKEREKVNAAPKTGPKALIDATVEEIEKFRQTGEIPQY